MQISEIFEKRTHPILSFEIFPPKRDEQLKCIDATLDVLSSLNPDFISVTFGAGGSVTNSATVDIASKIKHKYGIESLVHLTCLTYSKSEILTMIKNLEEHGIENVLALRGDRNPNIAPKEEFLHASDLAKFLKENSNLGISGACYPEKHPEAKDTVEDILNLKTKVDSGASHLISQLFFDNEIFYNFVEKTRIAGINVPIEAGVMPVINKAQIEKMVSLCGASIPVKLQRILNKYGDNKQALFDAGIIYCIEQIIDLIVSGVEGVHIYTMNNPVVAQKICDGIKNLIKC
jgi:methylenetetrahydrofolate reductase (NADPH)